MKRPKAYTGVEPQEIVSSSDILLFIGSTLAKLKITVGHPTNFTWELFATDENQ